MLRDVEENSLLLYSTQNELQLKLKSKLLERSISEIEKELESMQIAMADASEDLQPVVDNDT